MSQLVGILLAAGTSSRFGTNKLLHPLPDGSAMVVSSARNLLQALPHTIAVVRPDEQEVAEALSIPGIQLVENSRADEGMSSSVAAGIQAAADAEGWVIALADMPWVKPASIRVLVERLHQGASIVVPKYQGRRGNPVGFASKWKDALSHLTGDQGARGLITTYADEVEPVSVDDQGVVRDVDVPEDV
jgi:molybdenum cofactor cytidylyltransferase